jgi:tRNA(Ile)-lysidine synthase
MKDPLLLKIRKFLDPRLIPNRPLLIGYSGGPDSKALLYLLLECRRFFSHELHVAHVDHGWRAESSVEAQEIQEEVKRLGLIFHLKSLSMKDFSPGNSEEQGREHRLDFFSQVYAEIGAKALLLGHQANDQAETILKRVFEGASLFSLSGLATDTTIRGMKIWRPLLFVEKKEILQWLAKRNLNYFSDSTNYEKRFLRGKMREEMFPFLTASFGKQISANLCRLGEESKEVKEYFHKLNRTILARIEKQSTREYLNLNPYLPMSLIQLKYLLKSWIEQEGLTLSRQIIDGIAIALNESSSQKKFCFKDGEFHIDKGYLYFYKNKI